VPSLLFEDDDLGGARLLDDGGADSGTLDERDAGSYLGTVADHQHLAEFDRLTGVARELFDRDDVVLGDLVLLAAGSDHCKHGLTDMGYATAGATIRAHHATGESPRRGRGTISAAEVLSTVIGLAQFGRRPLFDRFDLTPGLGGHVV
jgi:hypothetical protein